MKVIALSALFLLTSAVVAQDATPDESMAEFCANLPRPDTALRELGRAGTV